MIRSNSSYPRWPWSLVSQYWTGLLSPINAEKHYFKSLNHGKLAANSDHYPFAKRGVPCIFLENAEGDAFPYYHTTLDNWKNAVFDSYEPVFRLVVDFVEQY